MKSLSPILTEEQRNVQARVVQQGRLARCLARARRLEAELAQEPGLFDTYVNATRAVAPPALPMVVWETGASTFQLSPAQQASWLAMVEAGVARHGLLGFNF